MAITETLNKYALIPVEWIKSAINFSASVDMPDGIAEAGADIAQYAQDPNIFVLRRGANVEIVTDWKTQTTNQAASEIILLTQKQGVTSLVCSSSAENAYIANKFEPSQLPFSFHLVNYFNVPSDRKWDEFKGKTSRKIFVNLGAELWWLIRKRFERTYEHVNAIASHPLEDLVSIPNHLGLITQLSSMEWEPRYNGYTSNIAVKHKKAGLNWQEINYPDYDNALFCAFFSDLHCE
jgi:phage terminase large subunit